MPPPKLPVRETVFFCYNSYPGRNAMSTYKYRIIVEQDEDRVYIASCPTLQGCYSQGDTVEEAIENIKDAIRLHIEAREALGEPIPIEVRVEEIEVNV